MLSFLADTKTTHRWHLVLCKLKRVKKVSKALALEKLPSNAGLLRVVFDLISMYCSLRQKIPIRWYTPNEEELLLLELIDGADKVENMQNKDTISKDLLSKGNISLKKMHLDGADFYVNYEG